MVLISHGHVEICQNGIWSSICSNGWDHIDASVACRQLGYSIEGTTHMIVQDIHIFHIRRKICKSRENTTHPHSHQCVSQINSYMPSKMWKLHRSCGMCVSE